MDGDDVRLVPRRAAHYTLETGGSSAVKHHPFQTRHVTEEELDDMALESERLRLNRKDVDPVSFPPRTNPDGTLRHVDPDAPPVEHLADGPRQIAKKRERLDKFEDRAQQAGRVPLLQSSPLRFNGPDSSPLAALSRPRRATQDIHSGTLGKRIEDLTVAEGVDHHNRSVGDNPHGFEDLHNIVARAERRGRATGYGFDPSELAPDEDDDDEAPRNPAVRRKRNLSTVHEEANDDDDLPAPKRLQRRLALESPRRTRGEVNQIIASREAAQKEADRIAADARLKKAEKARADQQKAAGKEARAAEKKEKEEKKAAEAAKKAAEKKERDEKKAAETEKKAADKKAREEKKAAEAAKKAAEKKERDEKKAAEAAKKTKPTKKTPATKNKGKGKKSSEYVSNSDKETEDNEETENNEETQGDKAREQTPEYV